MKVSWKDIIMKWVEDVVNRDDYKIMSHGENSIYIARPVGKAHLHGRIMLGFDGGGITIMTLNAESGKMDITSAEGVDVMNPEMDAEKAFKKVLAEKLKAI